MSIEEAIQVAQAAVSRAQAAAGQARVVVARIEYEMKGLRLTEAQLAQERAETQAHIAMDALQRALLATSAEGAQAAATAAQAAAVAAQTRANIAVAHMQIELMLTTSERLRGHALLGRLAVEQPVRRPGEETNTFTLPELRAAIIQSIIATNRAIEQADETERQVQLIDAQMQAALSAATPQAAAIALLAAEAAQSDALVLASAAQIAVSEVMAQATKDENALGAVDQIYGDMQGYLEAIQSAEPILPTTPMATAEQWVRRAVTRSAVARAQTAVAQAEVALAQARVLKIDLEPVKKTIHIVDGRLRATETMADLAIASADGHAPAAVAAAQAAAAAGAWSQIAISDIQLAIAHATRDDSEALEQLILAAEARLQEARRWAVDAEASADVAMGIATQAQGGVAILALAPVGLAQQAVAKAQTQAQVSVAKAQAAMLDVQLAIA